MIKTESENSNNNVTRGNSNKEKKEKRNDTNLGKKMNRKNKSGDEIEIVDWHKELEEQEKINVEKLKEIKNRSSVNSNKAATAPLNHNSANSKDENFEEIFDPSLVFLSSHRCYYWDSKNRVRKGKIFLTKNELLFKCSRMPFVKVRFSYSSIKKLVKIKSFKNTYQSVLYFELQNGKSFAFYRFKIPKKIVINIILVLIKENEEINNLEMDNASVEIKYNTLKRISKPIKHVASIIRSSVKSTNEVIVETYDDKAFKSRVIDEVNDENVDFVRKENAKMKFSRPAKQQVELIEQVELEEPTINNENVVAPTTTAPITTNTINNNNNNNRESVNDGVRDSKSKQHIYRKNTNSNKVTRSRENSKEIKEEMFKRRSKSEKSFITNDIEAINLNKEYENKNINETILKKDATLDENKELASNSLKLRKSKSESAVIQVDTVETTLSTQLESNIHEKLHKSSDITTNTSISFTNNNDKFNSQNNINQYFVLFSFGTFILFLLLTIKNYLKLGLLERQISEL